MKPTSDQSMSFAIMLHAGVPASDAILYFTESSDPAEIAGMLKDFSTSRTVAAALRSLEGPAWEELTLADKITRALNQHRAGMAYFLYRNHFAEVGAADQAKLNQARAALESYQAGTAGQSDPLSSFFDDLRSGKLKLAGKPTTIPS